jgi:acyl-CoA synthetase (NDP forming)
MDIMRMLNPQSVAVIGGGFWGRSIVEQLLKIGYKGVIHTVHPKASEVGGIPTVANLAAIGGPIDAAFIGVNREATIGVVAELAERGCGGAVCFASGFLESAAELSDGADLQNQLIAASGDMPIIGPNCYGVINYFDQFCLWPDQHGGRPVDRGVAIITQSSNIMINITMQNRGLPIGYALTVGNQAKIDLARLGAMVLADPRVSALGLHIEGINDIRALEDLARLARELGKGIVAIKVGKSDQARSATISHTASLAGEDAGADALLSRLGIGRVDTIAAMIETLKILHVVGPLGGNGVASMSCSGGEASLMADLAMGVDICYPSLADSQKTALRAALGPKVALANPLDYHTYVWGDGDAMGQTFAAMAQGPNVDIGVVVADFPRSDRCDPSAWDCVIDAVGTAKQISGKPIAILSSISETLDEPLCDQLIADGVVPLCGMAEGLSAIATAARIGKHFAQRGQPAPVLLPNSLDHETVLTERDAKIELAKHGLVIPKSIVRGAEQVGQPLDLLFPVVIKAQGIAHKTDAGGVRIGIASHNALIKAAAEMGFESYLIEEMITDGGLDLLVGVVCDPAHGFMLTLAAGGVMTEILADSTTLILPVTRDDVDHALDQLKIAPLLAGYRGSAPLDRAAVIDTVMAVQSYVTNTQARLGEVEINPVIVTPSRAVAVDALIRLAQEE